MNERIRELWSQAGGHYNGGNQHTWPEYTIDDPEKFAELIVKECASRVASKADRWGNMTDEIINECIIECATDLKQHFGVEE